MAKEVVVAITDAGGRGAALAEAYARSPYVDTILGLPGKEAWKLNTYGKPVITFPELTTTDIESILDICQRYNVTLLDVCQDEAVEVGLVDEARKLDILTIGPTRDAGEIEWNKIYARRLGSALGIKQPGFVDWGDQVSAKRYYQDQPEKPRFVKAAGLCEGKGAIGTKTNEELFAAIDQMNRFGDAGKRFLVEEWLKNNDGTPGEEFSYFVLVSGEDFMYLGSAQDNKPIGNRDEGPNTGGMGGHNEPDILDKELRRKTEWNIVSKLLQGLNERNRPYTGVLYFSGMRLLQGEQYHPYSVEFNARWGDPEAQLILPGIQNDWFETMMTLAEGGSVKNMKIESDGLKRVCVAVASLGYPGDYSAVQGKEILGIEDVLKMDGVRFYGAGIDYEGENFKANGGRLLYVVGEGENIVQAREKAYAGVSHIIVVDNKQVYRDDIAWREVKRFYSFKRKTACGST